MEPQIILEELSSGRVRVRAILRPDPETGRRIRLTRVFDTKGEAIAFRDGLMNPPREITVPAPTSTLEQEAVRADDHQAMPSDLRTTDRKARISLPKEFANSTVIIEQVSETEVRIRKAIVIPADEFRFVEELSTPLSDRDRDIFLALLDNPPPTNEFFQKATARHRGASSPPDS